MPYIVRNCPATYQNFEDKFVCTSQIKQKGFPFYCKDCTDCIIKRIVNLLDVKQGETEGEAWRFGLAIQIADLLEIEEVE